VSAVGRRTVAAAVAALACVCLLAPGAGAVIVTLPHGRTLSYQPLAGKAPIGAQRFDAAFSNLDYNGGPVMPSNTNYVIYWEPPTASPAFPSDYRSGIDQYFGDLAHDSGTAGNVDSVATQYNDVRGNFAAYNSTFAGSVLDTNPYPSNRCGVGAVPLTGACLTDDQIQAEISREISAHPTWPRDLTHEYFVVTPPGVKGCFDSNPSDGCSAGTTASPSTQYCAYHSAGNAGSGASFIYADQPYVNGETGCESGKHPNGSSDGALAGGLSHEHNESITDPYPSTAWADNTHGGAENGDKCGNTYGAFLGKAPNGSQYNQVVNGHLYYYQEEWSNQGYQCLQRFSFSGTKPTAQFTSTPASGNTMNFDATGSTAPGGVAHYHWQFEDPNTVIDPTTTETETTTPAVQHTYSSSGAHTVSLTVYAADGTSIGTSRVIQTGHSAPIPSFTTSPTAVLAGQPVRFTDTTPGSLSSESWNFGEGSLPAGGPSPTHTYATTGTFSVTLTVTDELGQTGSVTTPLTVRAPVSVPGPMVGPGQPAGRPPSSSSSHRVTRSHAVLLRLRTRVSRRGRYLLITVSGAGVLRLGARSIKVNRASTVTYALKLDRRQRTLLRRHHRVVLRARVVFHPAFGADTSRTIKITLRP